MAQQVLNLTAWRAMFPEFASSVTYPDATVSGWWTLATAYIYDYDNCLADGNHLLTALNLLTAHLAKSFSLINSGQQVVVLTGATEGSVTISTQPPPAKNGWQWWLSTTPYGVQLWALLQALVVGGFYIGGNPERQGFRKIYGIF